MIRAHTLSVNATNRQALGSELAKRAARSDLVLQRSRFVPLPAGATLGDGLWAAKAALQAASLRFPSQGGRESNHERDG